MNRALNPRQPGCRALAGHRGRPLSAQLRPRHRAALELPLL